MEQNEDIIKAGVDMYGYFTENYSQNKVFCEFHKYIDTKLKEHGIENTSSLRLAYHIQNIYHSN